MKDDVWTPEVLKRLKYLVKLGVTRQHTADTLSKEFSVTISKNAVCGKVARLGIRLPVSTMETPPKEKPMKLVKKPVTPPRVRTMHLRGLPGGCQYITGDAGKRDFCLQPTVRSWPKSSGSWCAHHEQVVYVVPRRDKDVA
jgi:hypothetical protein